MAHRRLKNEELLFTFAMQKATEKEFTVFLERSQLLTSRTSSYFQKIISYFKNYYACSIREYAERTLTGDSGLEIINKLDKLFLPVLNEQQLLLSLEGNLQLRTPITLNEEAILLYKILSSQKHEIDEQLYFFVLFIIKMKNKELVQYIQAEIVEVLKQENIYKKISDLFNYYENKKIDLSLLLGDGGLKRRFQSKTKYFFLISLLSVFEKENDFDTSVQEIKASFNELKVNSENEEFLRSGFTMLLNFIDKEQINDKYDLILNSFYCIDSSEQPNNNNREINKIIIRWLFNNILKNDNINMKELYYKIKPFYEPIINECLKDQKYKFIYIYLFKTAFDKKITKNDIITLYPKVLLKTIIQNRKRNNILCYIVFYFTLLYKYYKTIINFENLKKVQLQVTKNIKSYLYLDVHCIFLYLNKSIRKQILKGKTNYIFDIFSEINNDKIQSVNPFNNPDVCSFRDPNEFDFIYRIIHKKTIALIQSDKKFTNNEYYTIDKVKRTLLKYEDDNPEIIYFVFHKNINSSIISNVYKVNGNSFYFKLKGILITDDNADKYVLLYNKYTKTWHCFGNDEKWKTLEVHSLELVYFKKKNGRQKEDLLKKINVNAPPKEEIINELYKESLFQIYNINSSYIESNKLYEDYDVKKREVSPKQSFNIDSFYKGNVFNDDEILFEELEKVLKENTTIIRDENEELIEWINEKGRSIINKNISPKLLCYIYIIRIFQTNKKRIEEITQLFNFNNQYLSFSQIANLVTLSELVEFKVSISTSELLEIIKTINEQKISLFVTVFKFMEIILLILNKETVYNKIKELLNDGSSLSNPIVSEFICNNVYNYSIKKFVSKDGTIPLLDEIIRTLIDKVKEINKEQISLIIKYIQFHFKNAITILLKKHQTGVTNLFELLYNHKKQFMIADILMFAVEFIHNKKKIPLEVVIFYKEIKSELRKYFYMENTEPILKLSIIFFFSFIKNYNLLEKFSRLKIIPYEKDNPSNFLYLYLNFLFIKPEIQKHIKQNETNIDPNLLDLFNLFQKNDNEGEEEKAKELFDKIKQSKKTLDEIFNINNMKQIINDRKNIESKESFPFIILQQCKKHQWYEIRNKLEEQRILFKDKDVYYEFTGILFLEKNDLKEKRDERRDPLIYNKYNKQWYSIINQETQFILDETYCDEKMKKFNLIFTKKKKDRLNKEINFSFLNRVLQNFTMIDFSSSHFNYYKSFEWLQENKKLFNLTLFTEDIKNIYSSEPTVQKKNSSYCSII